MSSASRTAPYAFNIYNSKGKNHPKMGSPLYLVPYLLIATLATPIAVDRLIHLTKPNWHPWNQNRYWFDLAIAFLTHILFMEWSFPQTLPLLGSTRKMLLDTCALQAVILCKYFLRTKGELDIFLVVVLSTAVVYAHIKHTFGVYDVNLRDLVRVVAFQSAIYWTPYAVGIGCYVVFVLCVFCACGKDCDRAVIEYLSSGLDIGGDGRVGLVRPENANGRVGLARPEDATRGQLQLTAAPSAPLVEPCV